jgi:hypothetical protein
MTATEIGEQGQSRLGGGGGGGGVTFKGRPAGLFGDQQTSLKPSLFQVL